MEINNNHETKMDLRKRLKEISDLFEIDHLQEGFQKLILLFIGVSISFSFTVPKEKRQDFVLDLLVSLLADITLGVDAIEKMEAEEKSTPVLFKMNAEYKS